MKIYTIGHSTRSIGDFVNVLKSYDIEMLVDVRRFPSSKKFPQFNKESLEDELRKNNIEYLHYAPLGGFRKEGYKNFSQSQDFVDAIEKLLERVGNKNIAICCAEILFFRCHRRYIAEQLVKMGYIVIHIYDENKSQEHKLYDKYMQEKMSVKIFCDKKV